MSKDLPKISVIMPWHNTPIQLVERAISSLLRQNCSDGFELVICNDGSDSQLWAMLLQSVYGHLRGFPITLCNHSTQQGISKARNTAVEHAKGQWLIWLDADDEFSPDALETLLTMISDGKNNYVISECTVLKNDNTYLRQPQQYISIAEKFHGTHYDPLAQVIFSLQAQIIKKDIFQKLGGFNSSYFWAEITELFLRYVNCFGLEHLSTVPKSLYRYYQSQTIKSHSTERKLFNQYRIRALETYAKKAGIPFDRIEYFGRDPKTGFQHYVLVHNGQIVMPPYLDYSIKSA
jgi:glycosyltransferase involved in cell wall biosynthesis